MLSEQLKNLALRTIESFENSLKSQGADNAIDGFKPSPSQLKWILSPAKEKALLGANKSGKSATMIWLICCHITGHYPATLTESVVQPDGSVKDGITVPFPEELKIRPYEKNRDFMVIRFNCEKMEKVGIDIKRFLEKYCKGLVEISYEDNNPQKFIMGARFSNGARIYFTSNRQQLVAFEGGEFMIFASDEPPKIAHYVASLRGIIKKEARAYLAMTPLHASWINKVFVSPPPEISKMRQGLGSWAVPFYIKVPLKENPYYSEEEKQYWEITLSNVSAEEKAARLDGESYQQLGAVFGQEFSETKHVIPARRLDPRRWCLYHGLDPHDHRGPAQAWIAVGEPYNGFSPKIIIFEDYRSSKNRGVANNIKFCKDVEQERLKGIFGEGIEPVARYIDPRFGNTSSAEVESKHKEYYKEISALPEIDYPMGFFDGVASLETRHSVVRDMLLNVQEWEDVDEKGVKVLVKVPELQIFKTCQQTIEAFKNYAYQMDKAGVEEDYKDLIDAPSYALAAHPVFYNFNSEDSKVEDLSLGIYGEEEDYSI